MHIRDQLEALDIVKVEIEIYWSCTKNIKDSIQRIMVITEEDYVIERCLKYIEKVNILLAI